MLLTLPPGPVLLDGTEIARNASVLIKPETMQGRLRFTDPKGEAVDLVVQGCTKPTLATMGTVEMSMYGIENSTKIPFKLKLEIKVFKELFKLYGTIGKKEISLQDKSITALGLKAIQHIGQLGY